MSFWKKVLAVFCLFAFRILTFAQSSFPAAALPETNASPPVRAYFGWGETEYTDGDFYVDTWPNWVIYAWRAGGDWLAQPPCWRVSGNAPYNHGSLLVMIDRAGLTEKNLRYAVVYHDYPGASLHLDLLDADGAPVSVDIVGNLMTGSDEKVIAVLNVPLTGLPEAEIISLRRGAGEVRVFECMLFPADDELFTLDPMPDVSAAGDAARVEKIIDSPGHVAGPEETGSAGKDVLTDNSRPKPTGDSSAENRIVRQKDVEIMPYKTWMQNGGFVISRSALSGGGKRQTGGVFVMEDTFGQSSPIGFSSGGNMRLHAGYQQAEEFIDPDLVVTNVSVTPRPYNNVGARRFNPNFGEESVFSFVVSKPVSDVRVEVLDVDSGSVMRTFEFEYLTNGLHSLVWDGQSVEANRIFEFRLSGVFEGSPFIYIPSDLAEVRIWTSDNNLPVITNVYDVNGDPFFPDNGGSCTTYHNLVFTGQPKNYIVTNEIKNGEGIAVTNFTLDPNQSQDWDGGTEGDGYYTYHINATFHQPGPNRFANEKTGAIILLRDNDAMMTSADNNITLYHQFANVYTISETPLVGAARIAMRAGDLVTQSAVYNIEGPVLDPSSNAPAILVFNYDPAIVGDIEDKLQVRKFNETSSRWEMLAIANQFVDYANNRIIVEVWKFSMFGIFTGSDTAAPEIVIISPEPRWYHSSSSIEIAYTVSDKSEITSESVFLNGEIFTDPVILPDDMVQGVNTLVVTAVDKKGNPGRASVTFTVGPEIPANVRIEPEALKINPGILTAFVSLPEDYPAGGIVSATCDGAQHESMSLSEDGGTMAIKFRRAAIEAALAEQGEELDTHFVVRGVWTDGVSAYEFIGEDEIKKILK